MQQRQRRRCPPPPLSAHRPPPARRREVAESLQLALNAANEVNRHLAGEVERLALENDALRGHVQRLLKRLKPRGDGAESVDGAAAPPPPAVRTADAGGAEGAPELDARWAALRAEGAARGWLLEAAGVELGRELGRGGFGVTYLGRLRGAPVAVKAVEPRADAAEAFGREVRALSAVRHPNVLHFYGAVLEPGRCWLVAEHAAGGSLAEWLHGRGGGWARGAPARPLAKRLRACLDVARGVAALHAADPPVLHRDLKPANVLLRADDRALVADMGLARLLTPAALVSLTPETGSYAYMAPEVVRHEEYATAADIWSLGCLAGEALSSRRPYERHHLMPVQVALAVAEGRLAPDPPPSASPALAALLSAALNPDPLQRPSSARLAAGFEAALVEEEARAAREGGGGGGWGGWLRAPAAPLPK